MRCLLSMILLLVVSHWVCSQPLTKEQLNFLHQNSKIICKGDGMQPVWDVVSEQMKEKRFILLGEFNHGSKEIFELRTSLIKHLHEKLGVNVILFESGIGELITAEVYRQEMTARQMTNGVFSGWRTKEFVDLMEYVKAKSISIAGFDVQRSGGSFQFLLKEVADRNKIDTVHYYNLEQRYGTLAKDLTNKKAIYDLLRPGTEKLIADYRKMQNFLQQNSKDNSKEFLFSIVTLQNRVKYLFYMLRFLKDRDFSRRWAARDSAMAENVQWLIENVYKNERVVIVGHNFHISHYSEQETVMGEILYATYGKNMYSLGVFAGTGSYHDNGTVERQLLPADSTALDIKHIIEALKGAVNFISVPKAELPGIEWLYSDIIVNDTFIDLKNSNTLNLSKHFDGMLLLKKVSPPEE